MLETNDDESGGSLLDENRRKVVDAKIDAYTQLIRLRPDIRQLFFMQTEDESPDDPASKIEFTVTLYNRTDEDNTSGERPPKHLLVPGMEIVLDQHMEINESEYGHRQSRRQNIEILDHDLVQEVIAQMHEDNRRNLADIVLMGAARNLWHGAEQDPDLESYSDVVEEREEIVIAATAAYLDLTGEELEWHTDSL